MKLFVAAIALQILSVVDARSAAEYTALIIGAAMLSRSKRPIYLAEKNKPASGDHHWVAPVATVGGHAEAQVSGVGLHQEEMVAEIGYNAGPTRTAAQLPNVVKAAVSGRPADVAALHSPSPKPGEPPASILSRHILTTQQSKLQSPELLPLSSPAASEADLPESNIAHQIWPFEASTRGHSALPPRQDILRSQILRSQHELDLQARDTSNEQSCTNYSRPTVVPPAHSTMQPENTAPPFSAARSLQQTVHPTLRGDLCVLCGTTVTGADSLTSSCCGASIHKGCHAARERVIEAGDDIAECRSCVVRKTAEDAPRIQRREEMANTGENEVWAAEGMRENEMHGKWEPQVQKEIDRSKKAGRGELEGEDEGVGVTDGERRSETHWMGLGLGVSGEQPAWNRPYLVFCHIAKYGGLEEKFGAMIGGWVREHLGRPHGLKVEFHDVDVLPWLDEAINWLSKAT
ncbi:hypothetical protein OPT61_g693 [Boeremia exigua]|uniref:Uncharacterized protein n=1 Tax=Boeremia exigua TaxID=749465 RepID=A0ACC2IT26_9PLEO|nr:hypothetical protein OPT61_g693 [Boeremia exigua]